MELAPLLWAYLGTIVGSFTLTTVSVLGFVKDLAKKGYKFNLEQINSLSTDENALNFQKIIFFVPVVNLAFPFFLQNSLYKNAEQLKDQGIITSLSKQEQEIIENSSSLKNVLDINNDQSLEKCGTLIYKDSNNQDNIIEFIDINGMTIIDNVVGPEIEKKTKMEQRAILLQLLEENTNLRYETYKEIIEEEIKQGKEAIWLSELHPEDIEAIAKLIVNYGMEIKIYIEFYSGIKPQEEKEMLQALSRALKEIDNLDMQFPEEQPKVLKKQNR